MNNALVRIIEALRRSSRILWITGAGVSADSGLPTYRGVGGLYEHDNSIDGVPIEDALSGEALQNQPDLCWKAIHQLEQAVRGAVPNRAHQMIAASEARFPYSMTLTQNVDGLHRQAGAQNVIDMHGDIYDLRCTQCLWRTRVSTYAHLKPVPHCTECQALIRPDVVLFGELLPTHKITALERACRTGFDVVFSIGTTSVFPYIAQPVILARRTGALTIEINPSETVISEAWLI